MQRISDPEELERRRQSLIGNGWHISVIVFILQIFIQPLATQSTIAVVAQPAICNPAVVRKHSDFCAKQSHILFCCCVKSVSLRLPWSWGGHVLGLFF